MPAVLPGTIYDSNSAPGLATDCRVPPGVVNHDRGCHDKQAIQERIRDVQPAEISERCRQRADPGGRGDGLCARRGETDPSIPTISGGGDPSRDGTPTWRTGVQTDPGAHRADRTFARPATGTGSAVQAA